MVIRPAAPRASLSWKLTGFFLLFGTTMFIFMLFLSGPATTRVTLQTSTHIINQAFNASFPYRDASQVRALGGASNAAIEGFRDRLPLINDDAMLSGLRIYAREVQGPWIEFAEGPDGFLQSRLVESGLERGIHSALKRGVAIRAFPFAAPGSSVPAIFGLPRGPDGTEWALGISVNTQTALEYFSSNRDEILRFIVLLIVLSLVLGRVFANRFIRPLSSLAESAERYGKGYVSPATFDSNRLDEIGVLSRTIADMAREIEAKRKETEARLNMMEAMNRIDKSVLTMGSRDGLLPQVARIVAETMKAESTAIVLRDEKRSGWMIAALYDSSSRIEAKESPGAAGAADYPAGASARTKIAAHGGYADGAGERITDTLPFLSEDALDPDLSSRLTEYVELRLEEARRDVRSLVYDVLGAADNLLVSTPLFVDTRFLGSLVLVIDRDAPLSGEEKTSFAMLADQTAVALHSAFEEEARQDNFLGVIRSLSRAIDAKSRWTAGHSERVAAISVSIGEALSLSPEELGNLRIAAILHDVGKIGVSEAILDKPDKLTPEEYEEMKRHPSLGAAMLEDILSFEAIVPAVLYHHERWNGSGYPEGLAGEAIPLYARIIAIADVWDAITADRPYRKAFSREKAKRFMEAGANVLFDANLVSVFLGVCRTCLPKDEKIA